MSSTTVSARELTRTFGAFTAVDRVTFDVAAGEIFGFLGSNGAGKTTTIRMLCGLLAPTSGAATVAGFDVTSQPYQIKHSVGYMSQRFSLYSDLTVRENLSFWAGAYGIFGHRERDRSAWAIHTTGLAHAEDALVRDLPGGFRQRLALACALLHEPPVVFLDEPTGGVDPAARRRFWDLIDELVAEGRTVFVTTHYMDEAERCHRVALMHAGRIVGLDTVFGLKRIFPEGTVLELTVQAPADVGAALEGAPGVAEVAAFGAALHVTLDDPGARPELDRRLRSLGIGESAARPIAPSLEDVFIRYISRAEAASAAPAGSQA